jgi:apolipoprotein N-acyltransferase
LKAVAAIFLSLLSGFFLYASIPPSDVGYLAWISLVPLFIAIGKRSAVQAFFLSFLSSIVFFTGIFNWILEITKYTLLHHTLLAIYLGSYFAVFGLAFALISRKHGLAAALFAAPFIWVSLEYVRSNLSFLALPWGLLSHSQYSHPEIIQISSVTGAFGVSFLVVMVNSAIAPLAFSLMEVVNKYKGLPRRLISLWWATALVVLTSALLILSVFYGTKTLSSQITGQEIRVAVVQGNIEQAKKWDAKYARFIRETYLELTQKASMHKPELIIWPETAMPGNLDRKSKLYGKLKGVAEKNGAYLLLGNSQRQKFADKKSEKRKYTNSAFLIHPDPKITEIQRYDKIRLLPFGEYLPYKERIPWSSIKVPDVSGYLPGNEFTVFKLPDFRFSVTICWENIFPDLVRRFVKAGAQFIVNITNEAWFGETAAPYQFVSMSVFRAVENRVFVIRCANTGISCIIDPFGRIVNRIKDEEGKEIFVQGVLTSTIIPLESKTFYTRYGDWLVWVSMLFTVIFLLAGIIKKPSRDIG